MSDTNKKKDQKFNETLKRMLETPPKPHDAENPDESHGEKKKEKPVK